MPLFKPKGQFSKSLFDFIGRFPRIIAGGPATLPAIPRVPLVIRVGVAGPLDFQSLQAKTAVAQALDAILGALKDYADRSANLSFHERLYPKGSETPPAQLRLVGQLASGLDQMAASKAQAIGYTLHVVLPGTRDAFEHDLRRNAKGRPAGQMETE